MNPKKLLIVLMTGAMCVLIYVRGGADFYSLLATRPSPRTSIEAIATTTIVTGSPQNPSTSTVSTTTSGTQQCHDAPHVPDLAGHFSAARRNSEHVFDYYCHVLVGANPKTFMALDFFFGKDDRGVWMLANPSDEWDNFTPRIRGADPETFTLLRHAGRTSIYDEGYSDAYSKDVNHVYYFGQIVIGADPQSFVVDDAAPKESPTATKWDVFDARDKNGRFYRGVLVTPE